MFDERSVDAPDAPGEAEDLLGLLVRPEWHRRAACRDHPELSWFTERGESQTAQRAICRACPVLEDCGEAGRQERHGTWAGRSERERRLLRRKLRLDAA